MGKYTHVIWDWNGTLFNDVTWCINVINSMLDKRSINMLNGVNDYHNAFCFPIIDYYRNVGFNFGEESFELLAGEYISLYHRADKENCSLYDNVEYVLRSISDKGIVQAILSASEKSNLHMQMSHFDIEHYFDEVLGISNVYANSKIEIGLDYILRTNIKSAIIVGDTMHDYEVSQALNVDCVLISKGHQNKDKLLSCGVPVLDDIINVLDYVY